MGKLIPLRELLTTGAEREVIETQILDRVIEYAKQDLIAPQLLALRIGPESIPGDSINLIRDTRNSMVVHEVAELGEYPEEKIAFTPFTLTPRKFALTGFLSNESIEDMKFEVFGRHLAEAGYQFGRKLDSLVITDALQVGNTNTDIAGGTAITIDNITEGMRVLEAASYVPSDFVCGTTVVKDLRNIAEFVRADASGVMDPTKKLIGTIYGMRVWVTETLTATSALVMDRRFGAVLAEKRPISVERAEDILHDARRFAISARWDTDLLRTDSIVEITTT